MNEKFEANGKEFSIANIPFSASFYSHSKIVAASAVFGQIAFSETVCKYPCSDLL